ncbi:MAG: acyl-CoA synthetase FdrA, partial [Micrococcales bacterium]|nr:acyl-CoA synthetase FdrA [Micrococcales bacterium]
SGTGTQEVMSQLDRLGGGCSNVIGLGGRDLSAAVGGAACVAALHALDDDPATEVIVLVTKPPAPQVRERVAQVAAGLRTPVVALFLGERPVRDRDGELVLAHTCADAAELAIELDHTSSAARDDGCRGIRGLYTGGTLAAEAAMLLGEAFGLPLSPEHRNGIVLDAGGHRIVDLGDDVYTRGRPHPMIDPSSRADVIPAVFDDPAVAVALFDVVLGYGSGPDPAGAIAGPIAEGIARAAAQGRTVHAVASLCGTAGDPQGYQQQRAALEAAGVRVLPSNAAAVRHAIALVRGRRPGGWEAVAAPEPIARLLADGPAVVNVGLSSFAAAVAGVGAPVVQLDWAPTAGGDPHLAGLVQRLFTV